MGLTRIATSSAWRSYASPTTEVSGARLGDWRALKPHIASRRAWPTLALSAPDEETRTDSLDVPPDTATPAEPLVENQDVL